MTFFLLQIENKDPSFPKIILSLSSCCFSFSDFLVILKSPRHFDQYLFFMLIHHNVVEVITKS